MLGVPIAVHPPSTLCTLRTPSAPLHRALSHTCTVLPTAGCELYTPPSARAATRSRISHSPSRCAGSRVCVLACRSRSSWFCTCSGTTSACSPLCSYTFVLVQPPLAPSTLRYGAQLVRAGHELRLCIAPDYLSLVPTVAGLSVIGSQQTVAASMEKIAPHLATGKTGAMLKAVIETQIEFFAREADALKAACEGWAEIVIVNAVAKAVGYAVTEALHIKALIANVQPMLPTRELFSFSGSLKLPKFMHMFCWWLFWAKIDLPTSLKCEIDKWKAANGTQTS